MTHGTIMLSSTDESGQILVQTTHTGHTVLAICMICDLPRYVAEKHWYASVLAKREENLTLDSVEDFAKCEGDFGGLYLLEVAHWLTSYHFNQWRIIPKGFEGYCADYDLRDDAHIYVEIDPYMWKEDDESEKESGILIRVPFEEYKDSGTGWGKRKVSLKTWINKANKGFLSKAKIVPEWEGVNKGIFIPFYNRFAIEVLKQAQKLKGLT